MKTYKQGREDMKKDILKDIDEEIEYLEIHVAKANQGIKVNEERIQSWIFQAKRIRREIYRMR